MNTHRSGRDTRTAVFVSLQWLGKQRPLVGERGKREIGEAPTIRCPPVSGRGRRLRSGGAGQEECYPADEARVREWGQAPKTTACVSSR